MKNYYSILGVSQTATSKEIKARFRILAMQWHPDKNKAAEAHKMFIEITEAYHILIDAEKKKVYDELRQRSAQKVMATKPYEKDEIFEKYNKWTETEKSKAESFAKMSFKDFAKNTFEFADEVHTGCAQIIGFVFGFGFFLDGIGLLVMPIILLYSKLILNKDVNLFNILWMLPLAIILLFLGDILFYEPICKRVGIKKRWAKVPIFKKFN